MVLKTEMTLLNIKIETQQSTSEKNTQKFNDQIENLNIKVQTWKQQSESCNQSTSPTTTTTDG